MPVINSTQLDAFATIPHCLDNQFLPREVLAKIYIDDLPVSKAMRARQTAVRREYIRSLLYSPEVIINRAFALNEPAVFGDVRKYPSSMASLINNDRLTILLLNDEPSLSAVMDNPTFQMSEHGKKAWLSYLARYGDAEQRYLKLSDDEGEAVTSRFPAFIRQLLRLELADNRLIELFKPVAVDGYTPEKLDAFKAFLQNEAEPWLRDGPSITRSTFYRHFIMPDGADISKPNIDSGKRYSFELKLLADLAYDHNTPTALRRQSFIPTQMPSPLCLPPDLFSRGPAFGHLDAGTAEGICDRTLSGNEWYYESQETFIVPDWAKLTAEDVCLIQSWPEWTNFRTTQRAVADVIAPDQFDARLRDFFDALRAFQGRLAREIDTPGSALRHIKIGAKILKLVVRPVITWAGQLLLPGVASQILTEVVQEGVEFAIDISIDFLDQRHDQQRGMAIESYISRTDGVRQNVAANIQESPHRLRAVERIAEEPAIAVTDTATSAQKA
jgi:hypothetical protein